MSSATPARFPLAEVLFSLKCFCAAMLALYIASRTGLPRPFWAVTTTYIVAHPLAGNVRSKALFRFCGTLIGSIATVILVPLLSHAPELLTLGLALWVGGCLYLSLLDRTARSYVAMLAGYTAAVIGFPAVDAPPQLLFGDAASRLQEIGLGILCATVVHSILLPTSLAPGLLAVLDRSLGDARQWFSDVLNLASGGKDQRASLQADRQRLAVDITQLRLLSTHVPFDTSHLRWTAGALHAMQDDLAALTPTLSATEDRLQALVEAEGELAPDVAALLAQVARWLEGQSAGTPDQATALRTLRAELRRFGSQQAGTTPAGDEVRATMASAWRHALRISLAVRLWELVAGWRSCLALRGEIEVGLSGAGTPSRSTAALGKQVLHRDTGMALLAAWSTALTIILCSIVVYVTAWPSGSIALMMAAVLSCLFAGMDDPVPAIHRFLWTSVCFTPLAALYVLVLMPLVQDFGMLMLACAPAFLLMGYLAARPATALAGMAMIIGVTGTLALQDTASANFPSFLNLNLAQVLGIAAAALVTRMVRIFGADWVIQRIRRATWRELADMAAAPGRRPDDATYAARMLDRIALLAPRMARADTMARNNATDSTLRDLRLGADILVLQRVRRLLPAADAAGLMTGIGSLFCAREALREAAVPPTLLVQLDDMLQALLGQRIGPVTDVRAAITALVGIRRNLFPAAPAALAPSVSGTLS